METRGAGGRTDATGRNFISYRRSRLDEAARLVRALRVHGVPCWQDVEDLGPHGTEDQVRETLGDPATASALVWITPDVADSAFILGIEAPLIDERARRDDGFFGLLVAAGGLEPEEAGTIFGERLAGADPRWWNIERVVSDPLDAGEAASLARRLARLRLEAVHRRLATGLPLRVGLHAWRPAPARPAGMALQLDWSEAFRDPHFPEPAAWRDELEPALEWIVTTLATRCPDRTVQVEGKMSLGVAMALGYHLRHTAGVGVVFRHEHRGAWSDWSAAAPPEDSRLLVETDRRDPASPDVALIVSATKPVEAAFTNSRGFLPAFRGVVRATWPGVAAGAVMSPGQGRDIAERVLRALTTAVTEWSPPRDRRIHVFMSAPTPLAMLIGQQMNTFAPLTMYELAAGDHAYAPALTIGAPPPEAPRR